MLQRQQSWGLCLSSRIQKGLHWRLWFAVSVAVIALDAMGATVFVAPDGSQEAPYDTWGVAFSNIQDAVDYAPDGSLLLVTNGLYAISAQVSVTNGVTVQSVSGPDVTIIDAGGNDRCLYVAHPQAVVDGFTLRNGNAASADPVNKGGGVYLTATGTVQNCILTNNIANTGGGAYIYLDGGLDRCLISHNTASIGAGIYFDNTSSTVSTGGRAYNCVITDNAGGTYGGGAYFFYGGQMDSCTVAENSSTYGGGLYSLRGNSTWRNTIVYFNTATPDKGDNWYRNEGGDGYNLCTTPTLGTACQSNAPTFVNPGDYRVRAGSPCIDNGQSNAWMATAFDLDGNNRVDPDSGKNDIGAYEYQLQPLDCGFSATPTEAFAYDPVIFTATVSGTATNFVSFLWDLDGDGNLDAQGPDKRVVTNHYGVGSYSVSLLATNDTGAQASQTRLDYITIGAQTSYVVRVGTPVYPYTNWVTAATNIQDAIDVGLAGTTVLVSNGEYRLAAELVLAEGIQLRSVSGAAETILHGNDTVRCVTLNPDSLVEGFTLTHGNGGAYFYYGGTVRDCTIVSNHITGVGGGTQSKYGGTLERCTVMGNTATGGGGGSYATYSFTIRNCLYYGNTAAQWGGGVYFSKSGGLMESCTVADNIATLGGGVVHNQGGVLRNTIVIQNTGGAESNVYLYSTSGVGYDNCCTAPSMDLYGSDNTIADPVFLDPASVDYRVNPSTSPCIDTGLYQTWMDSATDLDGHERILKEGVDIGAYESTGPPPQGTVIILR